MIKDLSWTADHKVLAMTNDGLHLLRYDPKFETVTNMSNVVTAVGKVMGLVVNAKFASVLGEVQIYNLTFLNS